MPTANPRINVTLSQSLDILVSQLAAHTRVSKSQVLRELLEEAEPALQQVVALMDATAKATAGAKAQLARRLEKNIEDAQDDAAVHVSRLGRMTADLVSQAEAVRGKRPRRAPVAGGSSRPEPAPVAAFQTLKNPPPSNRGVKSTARRGKQATPLRAKRGSA